jgi:hypothetical protein
MRITLRDFGAQALHLEIAPQAVQRLGQEAAVAVETAGLEGMEGVQVVVMVGQVHKGRLTHLLTAALGLGVLQQQDILQVVEAVAQIPVLAGRVEQAVVE